MANIIFALYKNGVTLIPDSQFEITNPVDLLVQANPAPLNPQIYTDTFQITGNSTVNLLPTDFVELRCLSSGINTHSLAGSANTVMASMNVTKLSV